MICEAKLNNIDAIKKLSDANRKELGFILRIQIQEAIEQNRIRVAIIEQQIVGFVIYRHRKKDLQTTLAEICVSQDHRNQGIGKKLVDALLVECKEMSRSYIQLKCPEDLLANNFYKSLGFRHVKTEPGKSRRLHVWRLEIFEEGN